MISRSSLQLISKATTKVISPPSSTAAAAAVAACSLHASSQYKASSATTTSTRSLATLISNNQKVSAPPKPKIAISPNDVSIKPLNPAAPEPPMLPAELRLCTGDVFKGTSFGAPLEGRAVSGEVVFTTSLVGYPESMTDPSYRGQILVFTQPLIGNYGVPSSDARDSFGLLEHFEAHGIQVSGIVVNDYATRYSHWAAIESLGQWCDRHGVPAISGVDTRAVVSFLRERGSTLGQIVVGNSALAEQSTTITHDPNSRNLCAEVSVKEKETYNPSGDVDVALIDCGVKQNIIRCLAQQGAKVTVVPWDHDLTKNSTEYDGVFISNGPGDPRQLTKTVNNLSKFMAAQESELKKKAPVPIFGICMGNLVLGMAAGMQVYKLPFGNRGHNQPVIDLTTSKCLITSQNHGYALDDTKENGPWLTYFRNANDGSNEGIRHAYLPYSSVQFHPEAMGGPEDSFYLFSRFVNDVRAYKRERKRDVARMVSFKGLPFVGAPQQQPIASIARE